MPGTPPVFISRVFINREGGAFGFSHKLFPVGGDQATATSNMEAYLNLYKTILPTTWAIVYATLDNPDHAKDSVPLLSTGPIVGTYAAQTGAVELPADAAILMQFSGSPTQKNRHYFHGVWSQDVSNANNLAPSAGLLTALVAFDEIVMTGQLVGRYKPNTLSPPPTGYAVATTRVDLISLTNRKIGRPFGLVRGRRRRF